MVVRLTESVSSDAELVSMWLFGKSSTTIRNYKREAMRFLEFVERPLASVTLKNVQDYAAWLIQSERSHSSAVRSLAIIKALLSFGHQIGVLPTNAGSVVKLPPAPDILTERILSEEQVHAMLAAETNPRNHAILMLLYGAGLRVGELSGLKWQDIIPRGDSIFVIVKGKGGKTRTVLLPAPLKLELFLLRGDAPINAPVFQSRKQYKGGHLKPRMVNRIVQEAAQRAGIPGKVTPHWLRHALASHSLDRGAPIHLVQATLGHESVATTSRYLHARPQDSSARFLAL